MVTQLGWELPGEAVFGQWDVSEGDMCLPLPLSSLLQDGVWRRRWGGELADSDHADEDRTPRPCCPELIQGPATSCWELVRNLESEAAPLMYWIKILMLKRGPADLYILELEKHHLEGLKEFNGTCHVAFQSWTTYL